MTPHEILVDLFQSEDHHPFSNPHKAADLTIQRLLDGGYAIVPKDLKQGEKQPRSFAP